MGFDWNGSQVLGVENRLWSFEYCDRFLKKCTSFVKLVVKFRLMNLCCRFNELPPLCACELAGFIVLDLRIRVC